ncbi:MAG: nicotinamide-nucleotide amidohydrolase family protein [Planctomycetes bacterium]|nr:nicotinamide-nucleotide amidohydrolase family protein [Planctomycetota bacterium]
MNRLSSGALILSIGEELLDGRVMDRNAGWLAERLRLLGVQACEMRTIGDTPGSLHALLAKLDGSVPLILSSGGLGPTVDDRVRLEVAAAAQGLGAPGHERAARNASAKQLLVEIPGALDELEAIWGRQHDHAVPRFFLDQGRVPAGAVALANPKGTAWGFAVKLPRGTRVICHPGPPVECHAAWFGGGRDQVEEAIGGAKEIAYGLFHTVSVPESTVEAKVRDLMEVGGNPRMGITAHGKQVTLSVLAIPEAERSAEQVLEAMSQELHLRLGEWLWGRDGETQAEVVVRALREAGQTVATAESCTGGGLGAAITAVSGASAVYRYGWICYANEAKHAELGVPMELMEGEDAPGAVSPEVARALAEGARRESGADWGIGITGIAGPTGGTEAKPVGMVYLGLDGPQGSRAVLRQQWTRAGRSGIQIGTVRDSLELLRRAMFSLPELPERRG